MSSSYTYSIRDLETSIAQLETGANNRFKDNSYCDSIQKHITILKNLVYSAKQEEIQDINIVINEIKKTTINY